MTDLRHFGLKVRNFKCFEDWQGVDTILPINLIIGRNNSGKSAVLDFIVQQTETGYNAGAHFQRAGKEGEWMLMSRFQRSDLEKLFQNHQVPSLGDQTLTYALAYCLDLTSVTIAKQGSVRERYLERKGERVSSDQLEQIAEVVRATVLYPLQYLMAVRLRADRDIKPEESSDVTRVGENGDHATSLIECFLTRKRDLHRLVEVDIIRDLNQILAPDWQFVRIRPKQDGPNEPWELELEDSSGTLVPLSHLGSGVKTILLTLINLHLVPRAHSRQLSTMLFCLEELENNLHPAVQRRLFAFLREVAVREHCSFFLTTHSSSVINQFSRDDQAQVLHVTHDGTKAQVRAVSSILNHCQVLDDLDVRASDLLQANVVVWVEGPSDRIYFNRWMELWSDSQLQEQVHYQCVWYGGAALADLKFKSDDRCNALVNGLRLCRHAIVLMDSDRRKKDAPLKARVERVLDEVNSAGGIAWITAGREVENYIPIDSLRQAFNSPGLPKVKKFGSVFKHIQRSSKRKMALAKKVTPLMTREQLETTLDLKQILDEICNRIRVWNGLAEPESATK